MAAVATLCNDCGKDRDWESFCVQCEQLYCQECTQYHRRLKATRSHFMVDASHTETDLTHSSIDVMCGNECGVASVGLCLECKQVICDNCIQRHYSLKATKHHLIISARALEPQDDTSSVGQDRKSLVSYPQSQMSHAQANVQKMKGPYAGIYTNEFMSSAPADKEVTRVRGIAVLNTDGKSWKIVVADYKNRSLKLFNTSFQHVTSKDLKEDPRGIVAISNDHVAVTIADKKEIRIYKIETSKIRSQKQKTIKMKEKPFSIAFNKDRLAVETGEGEDGAIRILDIYGKEYFVIPGNTRIFGQFTGNTLRLALDYSKQLVFVVDISREVVHRVTFKGTLNWTVQIKSPRGVALQDNVLFVASSETNKIYQMNATDGMVFHLLDEDNRIKRPRYIAYNHDLRRLAVEIDGNHIKVYSIDRFQKE